MIRNLNVTEKTGLFRVVVVFVDDLEKENRLKSISNIRVTDKIKSMKILIQRIKSFPCLTTYMRSLLHSLINKIPKVATFQLKERITHHEYRLVAYNNI